jgi:hypothetical protein
MFPQGAKNVAEAESWAASYGASGRGLNGYPAESDDFKACGVRHGGPSRHN